MIDSPPSPEQDAWRQARGDYPAAQIALSFIVGWLFVSLGALGTLYAPICAWRTHTFLQTAVHANAPIVAFKSYPPSKSQPHTTYRPMIEGTGASGGPVRRIEVGSSAYPNPYRVGDSVEVVYPPGRPELARQNAIENVWGDTLFFAIVSPFAFCLGFGIIVWMRYFVTYGPEQLTWVDRWFSPIKLLLGG